MELKELYQEIILDHGKNPRNKGKCEGYTNDAKAHNPLCGDKVHIYLKLNNEKLIEDLSIQMFRPEFVYAHNYEPDDIIAWDNRRTLHKSTPYNVATERRVIRRTTIVGDPPLWLKAKQPFQIIQVGDDDFWWKAINPLLLL